MFKKLFGIADTKQIPDSTLNELEELRNISKALDRSMAVIEFYPDGRIIKANANFLEAVGYDFSEIEGKHHRIFCERDYGYSAEYIEFWQSLNRGKFQSGQFKRVTKSGQTLWLEATYNPIYDEEGKLVRVVKFATDITDKVDQEIKNRAQLDALHQSMAVIEFELDGTIVSCNSNFEATTGYRRDELIGKHHRMLCEPEYAASAEYQNLWADLNNGRYAQGKFKRLNKSGKVLWLEASYNPIYSSDGELYRVVKFASDVTEATLHAHSERESAQMAYRVSMETNKTAEEGAGVIEQSISEMKKVAQMVLESSQQIENLNQQSVNISSIAKTIEDIAEQTNLLALNAAIEAARAGEQGRGFAVVADEVRLLAARTSDSTSEITTMIGNIQAETKGASVAMDTCLNQVNTGVELANQTGEVILKIREGANQVVEAIDQFADRLDTV